MKKWEWLTFGQKTQKQHIIIDNRIQNGAKYTYWPASNKLALEANEGHKWTPLIRIDASERWSPAELKKYADTITDRLNAMEVEQKLKGDA
jgi:hypothetical protein